MRFLEKALEIFLIVSGLCFWVEIFLENTSFWRTFWFFRKKNEN